NVIIKKPASPGMENRQTVVMQSHLDMVHQKNADTDFNFDTDGINMFVDGDWVKAKGTTLGADNGIGVASIMTLLASSDIAHPPLEALFTIDEETGMTGALGLKGGLLEGKILLNLDTEDDHELTIGCAGGIDVTANGTYVAEEITGDMSCFKLYVKGLTGGHSGMDIHIGRGNANKIMNRLLAAAADKYGTRIHTIDGGGLRNAIPRESFSLIAVPSAQTGALLSFIETISGIIRSEYKTTDPNLSITIEKAEIVGTVLPIAFQNKLLGSIYCCANGIYRMSPDIPGLVQTSNNLARVLVKDGNFEIMCLTRSAVDSEKEDLATAIKSCFELAGATVGYGGSYPGWAPYPDASIVKLMSSLYKEKYGTDANVNACHAGLECGIIGRNYPGMEMISFGPNITGAHSPDEKVQISSVQKYWGYLLETLKRIPSVG
ncbi:MAG: aminoacyl-histidine dipeptidase, partial [Bacteroidetes bacterium]|nr:aminoacyl-histidine dipeptidase [Bacteroidota bacterium]